MRCHKIADNRIQCGIPQSYAMHVTLLAARLIVDIEILSQAHNYVQKKYRKYYSSVNDLVRAKLI